jgi:hypothetical protein
MKARIMALTTVIAVTFTAPSSGQTPRARTEQSQQPVVVNISEGGFRWGDAAIGAAATTGGALALAGLNMFRRQLQKEEQ